MTATVTHLGTNVAIPPRAEREWVTSAELQAESRLTYRRVDYWARTGLLVPLDSALGIGYLRRFPAAQITRATVLRDLLAAGFSLQACRRVIDEVLATGRVELGPVTIVHQGAAA